jgi:hypothetical protein
MKLWLNDKLIQSWDLAVLSIGGLVLGALAFTAACLGSP